MKGKEVSEKKKVRQFDAIDGLLYLGIKLLFGDKTPPIDKVLVGKEVEK